MKKTQLAFIISSVIATQTYAESNSFRDALQNSKFSGDVNNVLAIGSETDAGFSAGPMNNSKVGSSALSVKYETGSYKGLKFGTAFQFGHDWDIHEEGGGLSGEDDSRNSITSSNLQNLYLDYSFDKSSTDTSIRIGRQDIISPLIMRSSMFPMKDAFDAVVITNKDIPNTNLKLMYIDSWVKRYGDDASASPVQQDAHFDGSFYSVYLNNKSIDGLNIEAQWMSNNTDTNAGDPPTNVISSGPYDTTFLAATYKVPESDITLGAKYLTANYDNADDSNSWGVKAGTKIGGVGVTLAYTSTDEDNNLPGTIGHVPLFRAYANTLTDAESIAGVDATSLTLNHNLGVQGLKASLVYASWSQSDEGIANTGNGYDLDGASELGLDVKYKFQSVEGLSGRVQLSQMDYDVSGDSDMTYLRMHLKYQF